MPGTAAGSAPRSSFSAAMPRSRNDTTSQAASADSGAADGGKTPGTNIPTGSAAAPPTAMAGNAARRGGGSVDHGSLQQLSQTHGEDHTVTNLYWPAVRRYPPDCPRLNVRWFYAVDVAKVVPSFWGNSSTKAKPKGPPKKFVPFSTRDSEAVEKNFLELVEEQDKRRSRRRLRDGSIEDDKDVNDDDEKCKVPVNEDFLFDVDIPKRELAPAYWMGPTYDVRRGSWFFQDGSSLKSCEENLSIQLEEGYLKIKPWRRGLEKSTPERSSSRKPSASDPPIPKEPMDASAKHHGQFQSEAAADSTHPTYRLFGSYMNNVVTYEDATTAYLATDDFMSRMSSTVYQTFGSRFSGTKVIRGYSETKPKAKETPQDDKPGEVAATTGAPSKSETEILESETDETVHDRTIPGEFATEAKTLDMGTTPLERSLSLMSHRPNAAEAHEAVYQHDQREMEDLRERKGDEQGREIDHLILVSHGIGQRLGIRLESINFVHDINTLRKTMKNVYSVSPDLQALNTDIDNDAKNCRVQVLPV